MITTDLLLENLIKAVSFKVPGTISPSVITSYIQSTKEYYVSVIEYGKNHKDKKVLFKAKSAQLHEAIKNVSDQFVKFYKKEKDPLDNLIESL